MKTYVGIHLLDGDSVSVETYEGCCDNHVLDMFGERSTTLYPQHDSTLITPESVKHTLTKDKKMFAMSAEIAKYFDSKH